MIRAGVSLTDILDPRQLSSGVPLPLAVAVQAGGNAMVDPGNSRRDFLKTRRHVAAVRHLVPASAAADQAATKGKIVNFHPKMGYRRLGKTGYMISEISLGGHGGSSVEDRIAVLDKAVELGINYVDNNIDAECDLYGKAMARCKNARRERVVHRLRLLAGEGHRGVREGADASAA